MLLAREIENHPSDDGFWVARLTVELLRPIGLVPLRVSSRMIREGRKVQIVEASLHSQEVELARATGVRIRQLENDVPLDGGPPPAVLPEALTPWHPTSYNRDGAAFHLDGVEVRMPAELVNRLGPAWGWFRLRLPVVPGEIPSGLQRICAAADFPNGISNVVDPRVASYINPDLTIYVHRLPVDEWVMVDAHSWLEPHGIGFAEGELHDRQGRLGRSLQSLLVDPR